MMATVDIRDRDMLTRIDMGPSVLPVRKARVSDRRFISGAWCDSLRNERAFKRVDRDSFRAELERIIDKLLPDPSAALRIVHDPKDDDTLVGFAVLSPPILHYVYVRDGFRTKGLVPDLLEGLDVRAYSFETEAFIRRLHPASRSWKYTPKYTF